MHAPRGRSRSLTKVVHVDLCCLRSQDCQVELRVHHAGRFLVAWPPLEAKLNQTPFPSCCRSTDFNSGPPTTHNAPPAGLLSITSSLRARRRATRLVLPECVFPWWRNISLGCGISLFARSSGKKSVCGGPGAMSLLDSTPIALATSFCLSPFSSLAFLIYSPKVDDGYRDAMNE